MAGRGDQSGVGCLFCAAFAAEMRTDVTECRLMASSASKTSSGNSGSAAQAQAAYEAALKDYDNVMKDLNAGNISVSTVKAEAAEAQKAYTDLMNEYDRERAQAAATTSPAQQQQLRSSLAKLLSEAQTLLTNQYNVAQKEAQLATELAQKYASVATTKSTSSASSSATNSSGSSTDQSGTDADSGDMAYLLESMLPEMVMMPAMMIPSMVSGMGGMGAHPADAAAATPTAQLTSADTPASGAGGSPKSQLVDGSSSADGGAGDAKAAGTDAATQPASAQPVGNSGSVPVSSTDVKLPDGSTVHAPNAQAATAVRAALNGASTSDAYQQAGVTLPPAGTPVLNPVAPGDLQAGDVGVWKDHQVIALGNDKVLISGQVQSESSVGSSPDFLGWMRPTQTSAGQTATPVPAVAATAVPTPAGPDPAVPTPVAAAPGPPANVPQ